MEFIVVTFAVSNEVRTGGEVIDDQPFIMKDISSTRAVSNELRSGGEVIDDQLRIM
jgi:hypothetical protein